VNQLGFKRYGDDWEIQTRERLRGNQGSVAYYDGEQMKIVATDLGLPVGIAISADGRTVYVSQASRNIIQKFDRDVSSGALMQKDWIRIPGSPRNLTVDSDGTLWVSSRPHSVSFSGWFEDGVNRAPTQVFKVTPTADPGKQVQELYLNDDGQELSDGSVAAPRGNGRFVLGSRTDHKLLMCTQSGATKPADPAAKTTTS
jgi:DNA-binding beta-propeller fold protein YncE